MATERLDFGSLLSTVPDGDAGWQAAPENTVIGHSASARRRPGDGGSLVA